MVLAEASFTTKKYNSSNLEYKRESQINALIFFSLYGEEK